MPNSLGPVNAAQPARCCAKIRTPYFPAMEVRLFLASEAATRTLGAILGGLLEAGDIVGLSGGLGAGKTTLARALIKAAAGYAEAPSPTFGLVEHYDAGQFALRHYDLYRIEGREELYELGLEDGIDDCVSLIEWPERAADILPRRMLLIRLVAAPDDPNARIAELRAHDGAGEWRSRLKQLNERIALEGVDRSQ